jgi:hypothetical protein
MQRGITMRTLLRRQLCYSVPCGELTEKSVSSVRAFKGVFGHALVPVSYRIPSLAEDTTNQWPLDLHGFLLGKRVKTLRKKFKANALPAELVAALGREGFVWNVQQHKFEQLISMLELFKKKRGTFLVPNDFVVPLDDPDWPSEFAGVRLGRRVDYIRQKSNRLLFEQYEQLDDLGFVWRVLDNSWNTVVFPSLRLFKHLHGTTTDIPRPFLIPSGPPWPPSAAGRDLHQMYSAIRNRTRFGFEHCIGLQRKELEALGYAFHEHSMYWKSKILPALRRFHHLQGHSNVPYRFVVEHNSPLYASSLWGLRLGWCVHHMRQGKYAAQVAKDEKTLVLLDFQWEAVSALASPVEALPLLRLYCSLHDSMLVPQDFTIPESAPWPQHFHGLKLGLLTRNLRRSTSLTVDERDALTAAGFVWDVRESRFEGALLPAFEEYARLHGDCIEMPMNFIVPDAEPWTQPSRGLSLGRIAYAIRTQAQWCSDPRRRDHLLRLGVLKP